MKNKQLFLGILIGIIITSITVGAAIVYTAKDISFSSDKTTATNVEDAIDELYTSVDEYTGNDIVVATWMNDHYTVSTSWESIYPNYVLNKYLSYDASNNKTLTFKEAGKYIIYYQVASDCLSTTCSGSIRLIYNGSQVESCSSYFARCDNKVLSYTTDAKVGDTIRIDAVTSTQSYGARAVVNIIKIAE